MFESRLFHKEINDIKYVIRVLVMQNSYFIFISEANNEVLDVLALAMQTINSEVSKTTILTNGDSSVAEDLAYKVSKKLNKPVFLSCHGIDDRLIVQPELTNYLFSQIDPILS